MEIIFYNKENTEGFIYHILNKHKIYDMDCYIKDNTIYLEDNDNIWEDEEVYQFFMEDLFIFTNDNVIPDLLTEEEFKTFCRLFHRIIK